MHEFCWHPAPHPSTVYVRMFMTRTLGANQENTHQTPLGDILSIQARKAPAIIYSDPKAMLGHKQASMGHTGDQPNMNIGEKHQLIHTNDHARLVPRQTLKPASGLQPLE